MWRRTVAGLSKQVIQTRDELIRSQIEAHAPTKDNYTLVARIVNVGVALLVYVRDEDIGQRVRDVQTQWTGCGPMWMGNKGAVGVRFRLAGADEDDAGETFTYAFAFCFCFSLISVLTLSAASSVLILLLMPETCNTESQTTVTSSAHSFLILHPLRSPP